MAWSVIREATEDDYKLLEKRAASFMDRHGIGSLWDESAISSVEEFISSLIHDDKQSGIYLQQLWLRIIKRALKHQWAEGIAYGHVGFGIE